MEELVAYRKPGDRPTDRPDYQARPRKLTFELMPETIALLRQLRQTLADERGDGEEISDDELLKTAAECTLSGGGDKPAKQIALLYCTSCKVTRQLAGGREHVVSDAVLEEAMCSAGLLGDVEAENTPRINKTLTEKVWREILLRDRGKCVVPGCTSARNLTAHHIEYQSHGGTHEKSNVTVVCGGHHRALHRGKLSITGKAPDWLEIDLIESGFPRGNTSSF